VRTHLHANSMRMLPQMFPATQFRKPPAFFINMGEMNLVGNPSLIPVSIQYPERSHPFLWWSPFLLPFSFAAPLTWSTLKPKWRDPNLHCLFTPNNKDRQVAWKKPTNFTLLCNCHPDPNLWDHAPN